MSRRVVTKGTEPILNLREYVCLRCGRKGLTTNRLKKFCSEPCRRRYTYMRRLERQMIDSGRSFE